jgi:cytochrome P450/NADPH-cytochrome P450 reductase
MRACIGRPFAWQEILLAIASIVQKFDLSLVDPSYTLELKQALTIKPKGLQIRAALRTTPRRLSTTPSSSLKVNAGIASHEPASFLHAQTASETIPLYVLYGSNTGTSEAFAQRIASDAPAYGFRPSLGTMDSATERVPKDGPVIIVTASFEGEPADNAAKFVDWLENIKGNEFDGVRYGVFGCGNHDWVQTYQRIPTLCDSLLEQRGGRRLIDRGEGDAGSSNFFEAFDEFEGKLWAVLSKEFQTSKKESTSTGFEVKTVDPGTARAAALRQPDAALGRVVENRVLTKPGVPVKRHLEFVLPEESTARAGDYLAILPHNPPRDVHRALAHFELSSEQQVIVSSISPTSLPLDTPVSLAAVLSGYVELSQPATTRDLRGLIEASTADSTRTILEGLINSYAEKVLAKRLSVLDILEAYKDIKLSLTIFLQMLPTMRVRQYSISSSPLWNPQHVTLTISVVDGPAISGRGDEFLGVASNYLANLRAGDKVQMAVRPSNVAFHPPADPLVPLVLFCAGSGLAPMRGFIQERAVQKQSGREVGKALLFFGCRSPDEDFLYSDSDIAEWIKLGVVDVRPAFSRSPSDSEGCKYVQDRIWRDREDITKAYEENAKFFTCGSGKIATGIKHKLIEIIKGNTKLDDAEAVAQFEKVSRDRYATDIFD